MSFTLNRDTWVQVVAPGGNADKMLVVNLGMVEARFTGVNPPDARFRLSQPSDHQEAGNKAYVLAPAGLEVRAWGPVAVVSVGDMQP